MERLRLHEGGMTSSLIALGVIATMTAANPSPHPGSLPVKGEGSDAIKADAWHAQRIERLKADDGWLTLVGLHWLNEGDNVVGSGEDAPVQLPASAPKKLGT